MKLNWFKLIEGIRFFLYLAGILGAAWAIFAGKATLAPWFFGLIALGIGIRPFYLWWLGQEDGDRDRRRRRTP